MRGAGRTRGAAWRLVRDSDTIVRDMRTIRPVADTLFGRTRREVLGLLYSWPDRSFYVREIARATHSATAAVQKELNALAAAGLLERAVRGRQVHFTANRNSPVFMEIRSLIAKTVGAGEVLRQGLRPVEARIAAAFVFGSVAKGEERGTSDIDLFVIGEVSFGEIVDSLTDAQRILGRDINPVVQSTAEFSRRVRAKDHFVMAVLETPRLFVIGGDNELGQVAGKRLVTGAQDKSSGNRRTPRHRRTRPARQRS